MSEIDSYKRELIGIVNCPSAHEIMHGNPSQRDIPLYRLDEDAHDGCGGLTWGARRGDLLLGGGSGESAALRISIPEAFDFSMRTNDGGTGACRDACHAYWSQRQAEAFCDGYAKLGWAPPGRIEVWLVEHILAFIVREYPGVYGGYPGSSLSKADGSICRSATPEEKESW